MKTLSRVTTTTENHYVHSHVTPTDVANTAANLDHDPKKKKNDDDHKSITAEARPPLMAIDTHDASSAFTSMTVHVTSRNASSAQTVCHVEEW
jgi:hypothetical protein